MSSWAAGLPAWRALAGLLSRALANGRVHQVIEPRVRRHNGAQITL
jgi:hypothetical protein